MIYIYCFLEGRLMDYAMGWTSRSKAIQQGSTDQWNSRNAIKWLHAEGYLNVPNPRLGPLMKAAVEPVNYSWHLSQGGGAMSKPLVDMKVTCFTLLHSMYCRHVFYGMRPSMRMQTLFATEQIHAKYDHTDIVTSW